MLMVRLALFIVKILLYQYADLAKISCSRKRKNKKGLFLFVYLWVESIPGAEPDEQTDIIHACALFPGVIGALTVEAVPV